MQRYLFVILSLAAAMAAPAAEVRFDFSAMALDRAPTGCVSMVSGQGKPGSWKVLMDDIPLALPPITPNGPSTTSKAVVGQMAEDFTDEHFPMLVLGNEIYTDFKFTTRFKIVSGILEQMAGVAFRVQDDKNYYVVRASALGNNFRFYKVVNGLRGNIIGPELPVAKGEWHEITVECKGNQIHCSLDGKQVIPTLTDNTFGSGKIALWTKSDSVSYFADPRVEFTPREPPAQELVRNTLVRYPKLLGLKISMMTGTPPEPHIVASKDESEIGKPGEKTDANVIKDARIYFGKDDEVTTVTIPLRDRNGDVMAAVKVQMKSFRGQTEENAIIRAMPIVKSMQKSVPEADELN